MLMEYKEKKRAKRMLVLAVLAAVLMLALAILLFCNIAIIDKELLGVSYMIFAVYMIVGAVVIGLAAVPLGAAVVYPLNVPLSPAPVGAVYILASVNVVPLLT